MPHSYPYSQADRLLALRLDNDFELSSGAVPPSSALGGATQFKQWMDTSTTPPTLRIATAARASAGYVAGDWTTLGTLDAANHRFNYAGWWSGDFTMTGSYVRFLGTTATLSGSGGPLIYAGADYVGLKLGSSNNGWRFVDYNGNVKLSIDNTGQIYLNGMPFAGNTVSSGGNIWLFDAVGNQSIYLAPGQNAYRNAVHTFTSVGASQVYVTINATGLSVTGTGYFSSNCSVVGNYLYLNGGGGAINAAGGPLIYTDNSMIVLKIGSGAGGVRFQDYPGTQFFSAAQNGDLAITGTLYSVGLSPSGNINGTGTIYTSSTAANSISTAGGVTVAGAVTCNNVLAAGVTANGSGLAVYLPNGSLQVAGNIACGTNLEVGGTFQADTTITCGGLVQSNSSGLAFNAPNGSISCGLVLTGGSLTVTSAADITGAVTIHAGGTALNAVNGDIRAVGQLSSSKSAQAIYASNGDVEAHGNIIAGNTGLKPGGGPWDAPSDIRIKRDVVGYTRGLEDLLKLDPVSYCYNGLGGVRDDGRVFVGLVADAVRPVMPEMVGSQQGKLNSDDEDETELLTLDANPLIYAMLNAIKELNGKIAALEGG